MVKPEFLIKFAYRFDNRFLNLNLKRKYRITVEDETTLENKLKVSWKLYFFIVAAVGFFFLAILISIILLSSSPLRNSLPGYLKESERAATEEQHLRLDSLLQIYEMNEAYLTSVFNALEQVQPNDSLSQKRVMVTASTDSLLPTSEEERKFVETIRERDKYNIAVASPVDAEILMFGSVHDAAVISEKSTNSLIAELIIPHGEPVSAVAEGKVISIASSPRAAGGYEVIIQHPKGFLSKSGRLAQLLIRPGEHVTSGQIIGSTSSSTGRKADVITFELWHNGDKLIPSRYLKGGSFTQN